MTFQYLRGALNNKAITKYYDFNLQGGYKPSRMLTGLTTSQVECFTSAAWHKEESVGDVDLNTKERQESK